MRVQSVVPWIVVVGTLTSWSPRAAVGQQLALAARTPRFFYAPAAAAKAVEIDVSRNAVLGRVVSLQVEHSTIGGLLAEIQRQTGLTFAYDPHFPATRPITLEAESITVAAALGAILVGTGVDVVLMPTGHVWLTESKPGTPRVQEGTIVGRVTDKRTEDPIIGATVMLDPTRQSATTGADGRYRFPNLSPGNYTVRARYIGYRALVVSATVHADQEVVVDFPLEKSAQRLDEVVTTGTVVPTEVRALPTPVTVVTASDIEQQRPRTTQQLFRQAVPSAVAWNFEASPQQTAMSVRGASSLNIGAGSMKVYLDGIEISDRTFAAIDPNSIERIEVVRGPQASAIYGSDAIGGVMQVFSKRGDLGLTRPQIDAQAAWGAVQSPYPESGALRQEYTASLRGGSPSVSYSVGGGYTRAGDWAPEGGTSLPSAYGGVRFTQGLFTFDLSGRYYVQNQHALLDPRLAETGFIAVSKPFYRATQYQQQTLGARLGYTPTSWWQHNFTVGVDRLARDLHSTQPRLTTPADTFLIIDTDNRSKVLIAYNTSAWLRVAQHSTATLTVGGDHYTRRGNGYFTFGALNATGTINNAPDRAPILNRHVITNTGYFAQAQLNVRETLFLTGGLRAERNSSFGTDLGTPLSPRVGISYAPQLGSMAVKLRGSYGEAIHPPDPGQEGAQVTPTILQLANPLLGPERQKGWDAGFDLAFGRWGSFSATYYHQIARDLIQFVLLDAASTPQRSQYQNVGRVRNTGFELEGTFTVANAHVKAQYAHARSRVQELGPNYTGDLRIGDQVLLVPRHTVGASVTILPIRRTSLSAGLTYVGEWTNYDFAAEFRCFAGTGPCAASFRDYITTYPGFVKLNLSISRQVTPAVSGFVSVDNVTNNDASEFSNAIPVIGRVTMLGFRVVR